VSYKKPHNLIKITDAASEPITTADLKTQLRIDLTEDDTLLGNWIKMARLYAEDFTRRSFINTTWDVKYDYGFPCQHPIELPRSPLASVTSITYIDTNGDGQTVTASDYNVDTSATPGRIYRDYGYSWPSTQAIENAVTIRFVAGYGSAASSVPQTIIQAIALMVGAMYEYREAMGQIPPLEGLCPAAESLLWMERVLEA